MMKKCGVCIGMLILVAMLASLSYAEVPKDILVNLRGGGKLCSILNYLSNSKNYIIINVVAGADIC